ncbi:MAG: DUF1840 domain-containing protein [Pseudomonadota bacterium]|nr:DUF1840 domain-containing protein [Pseudomonadota bacterium]
MLYKFKSQAAADVIMLRVSAEELLKIIGKEPGATGIVTVAQIPAAIAALRAEVARREAAGQPAAASTDEQRQDGSDASAGGGGGDDDAISLRRRAAPFIELLQVSHDAGKDVVWGV